LEKIKWVSTEAISVRDSASTIGFNLHKIDLTNIADDKKKWIIDKIVKMILDKVQSAWEDAGYDSLISGIEKGVYVITLADNISVQYKYDISQVLYIGRGKVRDRIKNHLVNWITHLSESLQDIKFKFWFTEIIKQGSPNAFKNVESDLICIFRNTYGEFPLLNKKNGDTCRVDHEYDASLKKPFRINPKAKTGWCIRPMEDNDWFRETLDADE